MRRFKFECEIESKCVRPVSWTLTRRGVKVACGESYTVQAAKADAKRAAKAWRKASPEHDSLGVLLEPRFKEVKSIKQKSNLFV